MKASIMVLNVLFCIEEGVWHARLALWYSVYLAEIANIDSTASHGGRLGTYYSVSCRLPIPSTKGLKTHCDAKASKCFYNNDAEDCVDHLLVVYMARHCL